MQKHQAESRVQSAEQRFKTVSIEVEEMREVRRDLERQIIVIREECGGGEKKYENEARLRIEDVDMLKKKFGAQVADLSDQVNQLVNKIKQMEQQKTRLQQEVSVLVKDLETSQVNIKEFQSRLTVSERRGDDLAAKLREMTNLFEKAEKENKARANEILRLANDFDRAKMDNEGLRRDNGKLSDEVRALKMELDGLKKRFHELDSENRKLAHDREELARAYKDADSNRNKAEVRVGELENELKKLRGDAERRLMMKDEELVNIKKKLSVEIESLTVRLHEAESRLKNEVEKIKQKMSVKQAQGSNVQLQDTCKVQQTKIMELTAAYDDTSRKLQSSVEQYQVTIKRLQIMDQELSTMKVSFGAATKDRAVMETKIKELTTRITEITNINNNV